ncbi:hypothetical protein ACAG26_15110 [Mycobacterium sp. pUA109]|uniref:hypothetical protein n=1 Tax=Mycobacterium sp. pUA109 TaxID=3238982 RepID=UPI00351AEE19
MIAWSLTSVVIPAQATADPIAYPDITGYEGAGGLQKFLVADRDGVWFATPTGMLCGIGDDGSYGCSGQIPGANHYENEIGWFPGHSAPRAYHADEPRFDSGVRQHILTTEHRLFYRGSTCAVTLEGRLYCIHGDDAASQMLLITNKGTYVGGHGDPINKA